MRFGLFNMMAIPQQKSFLLTKHKIAPLRKGCNHLLQHDKDFTNEVMFSQDNIFCVFCLFA